MNIKGLEKVSPQFDWPIFFKLVNLSDPGDIDVGQPEFFTAVGKVVSKTPIEDLKTYLKWNVLRGLAPYLSSDFVNERFDFYSKFLNGSKAITKMEKNYEVSKWIIGRGAWRIIC